MKGLEELGWVVIVIGLAYIAVELIPHPYPNPQDILDNCEWYKGTPKEGQHTLTIEGETYVCDYPSEREGG